MFSEVCNDVEADVMRLYIILRHNYPEKNFRADVSTAAKLRVFLAQKEHPMSINSHGNFWLYLNLNSLLWIV